MVKKIFFYIVTIISFFIGVYVLINNFAFQKILEIIQSSIVSYQYNFIIEQKYEKLRVIKQMINNYYKNLVKVEEEAKIKQARKELEDLENMLNIVKHYKINSLSFLLDYISMQRDIKIINLHNKIIADENIANLGKEEKIVCNPFISFGKCEKEINGSYYIVLYHPYFKFFLEKKIILKKHTFDKKLLAILKSIPNIIVFYKGKIVKGKISNKYFYIASKISKNIFIAERIKYSLIDELSTNLSNELKIKIKKYVFKGIMIEYFILIISLYLLLFFIFRKKIQLVDLIYEKYKNLALKDKLLDIYNREGFKLKVDKYNTLLVIDLDNFKYINDTFGHLKGDEILREFVFLLKEYFKDDLIGRWGGDEFILATNKNKETIKKNFYEIIKKLKEIQQRFDKNPKKILSCSVGGCLKKDIFERQFEKADLALYEAKKKGKGKILFYEDIDYIKIE